MVVPTIKEQILSDLDRLSPKQQERAAALVHDLARSSLQGASVEDLMKVAGTLDDKSAREMMEAIEEGCEQVDADGWRVDADEW
ncbi:MAG: hypothetical protein AAF604_03220 [Acidobacteriota bacterium]